MKPTTSGLSFSKKSPVPRISNTMGGEIKTNPEENSLNKRSNRLKRNGMKVPTIKLEIKPVINETIESLINGSDPAKNILRTSLPRGSVPNKWEPEGVTGCGNTDKSKPTIGS
jgi:hypothetical protein